MIVARAPKVAAIITVFSTLIARALSIYIIVSAVSSYERCVFIFEMNVRFDNCVLCTISCERVDGSCARTIILFLTFFIRGFIRLTFQFFGDFEVNAIRQDHVKNTLALNRYVTKIGLK